MDFYTFCSTGHSGISAYTCSVSADYQTHSVSGKLRISLSRVRIFIPRICAVAIIIRSHGSLWTAGNDVACSAIWQSIGISWIPWKERACGIHFSGSWGSRILPFLCFIPISKAEIEEIKRFSEFFSINSKALFDSISCWDTNHRKVHVSSKIMITCIFKSIDIHLN